MEISRTPSPDPFQDHYSAPLHWEDDATNLPPRSFTLGTLDPRFLHRIPPLPHNTQLDANRLKADQDHGLFRDDSLFSKKRLLEQFHVESTDCSEKGDIRPSMEDRHLVESGPLGTLILVCDGHSLPKKKLRRGEETDGLRMATEVVNSAREGLIKQFHSDNFHFQSACETWAEKTHEELPKNIVAGTTAAIAFIEKINGILNVGNIGDSKIVVFREHRGCVYAIPMSPIINWDTPECIERVKKILTEEEFAEWVKLQGKERRFAGLNLVGTLGDHQAKVRGQTALTHMPVCSRLQLKPGDRVLCACDGLFDFASIQELQDLFATNWLDPSADFAKIAVEYALKTKKSTDNVTAVVATMIPGKAPAIQRADTEPLELSPTQPIDYDLLEKK